MMKKIHLLAVFTVLLTFGGRLTAMAQTEEADTASNRLLELYTALGRSYADWEDVYMPVNLSLESPKNASISGRATMVRDKEIYLSLRFMGVEAAVLYVREDSIFAVDKYHRCFVAESMPAALGGYEFTLGNLQDLILGRAFAPGQGTVSDDVEVELYFDEAFAGVFGMEPLRRTGSEIDWWSLVTDAYPPVLTSQSMAIGDNLQVDFIYADHAETPAGMVAANVTVMAIADADALIASIRWNLDDAKWNVQRKINFKRPKGYKMLDLNALLRSFVKF